MTLAITPGERVRAAAISSRPTWAMNLTAGSAAAAGRGAAVSQTTHAIAKTHAEIAAAATPELPLRPRRPQGTDNRGHAVLDPSVARSQRRAAQPGPLASKRHATRL